MENEKYYGWTNRDTWLVMIWLNNDENNYTRVQHKKAGIGTNKNLRDMNCCETMNWLRGLHYGDSIDWHNVNIEEIREAILSEEW